MEKAYLKYKEQFKKQCLYRAIACGVGVLALAMLVFLPLFSYEVEGLLVYRFSLMDELKLLLEMWKNGGTGMDKYTGFLFGMFHVIGMISSFVAVIMLIVEGIKCILRMTNIDDYALEQYDLLKVRKEEKRRFFGGWGAWGAAGGGVEANCYSAVILEIIYIAEIKAISSLWAELGMRVSSHFVLMNSVSFGVVLVIGAFIATVVLFTMAKSVVKKVKIAVLKEEYNAKEEKPSAPTAEAKLSTATSAEEQAVTVEVVEVHEE